MQVCIILREPYPVGMACSGRIHLYARGLIQHGHDVRVIIPLPLDRPGQVWNPNREGKFEGVPYEYAWKTTVRSRSFFGRRLHDLFAPFNAAFQCAKMRPNFILLTGTSTYLIFLFRLVAWIVGAKYIIERSEIPFFTAERLNLWQRLYVHYVYKFFDGIIVISDSLKLYFTNKIRKNAFMLKLPILVDVDKIYNPNVKREKIITYTGPLTDRKSVV